jgi:hypothetical protein
MPKTLQARITRSTNLSCFAHSFSFRWGRAPSTDDIELGCGGSWRMNVLKVLVHLLEDPTK